MASPAEGLVPDGPDEPAGRAARGAAAVGGMSWSWELDLASLLEALAGPAPWLRAAADDAAPAAQDAAADGGAAPAAQDAADRAAPAAAGGAAPAAGADAAGDDEVVDPEAEEAAYREAVAAGRVSEVPLELVAGRIAESLPAGPVLAGWLAQARAADVEDGALAGVAASFRRLASWASAGELAAVAQIASRSARTDRRAEVDAAGRPDRVTADAAGQVSLALAMSHDGAASWADLGVMLTWRLPGTGAALAAGEIDLSRARMIVRMTGPLSDEAARQAEAAVLGRAGWLTLGQLHAALRRAVITADPGGAERRRRQAERDACVALYPEDEGTATLAGYSLPGVEAAAAMARITALARAMKAAGSQGQIDWLRAHVFLGLLLGTPPFTPPADPAPPGPPPSRGPHPPSPPPPAPPPGAPPPGDSPPGASPPGDPPPADSPPDSPPADSPRDESDGSRSGRRPPAAGPPAGRSGAGTGGPGPDALAGGQPESSPGPWPGVLPYLPSWHPAVPGQPPAAGPSGLLNLTVPLRTLSGDSPGPGQLSWLGVVTASQARQLAVLAARHAATRWRVVVANPAGQAIAVARVPRARSPGTQTSPGDAVTGLIGRVTLVVRPGELAHRPPRASPPGQPDADAALALILDRALTAGRRAAEAAAEREEPDRRTGRCAHRLASPAYRPPPRIAELVTARDGTCRFPPCRRPADQCDLDHTVPHHQGGPTCSCNLGGQCRSHHQLKQHPRWSLRQTPAGVFEWTTPAGRSYLTRPDPYSL